MVELLARYLRRRGVRDVAVLEAPTVYGNDYAHRSVAEVASYFGFDSPAYRIVDISEDLRPYMYERGFVQHAISGSWLDADLRIVMPKLRTAPTDFAHLSLCTLEGSTGRIDDTVYAGRRVDYRSATMMLLDVAPPDFLGDRRLGAGGRRALWRHGLPSTGRSASGLRRWRRPVRRRGGTRDLGIDPRRAPIVRMTYHWFGLSPAAVEVDGRRPDLRHELRGAHASRPVRALGMCRAWSTST